MRAPLVAMEGNDRASGTAAGLALEERSKPNGVRVKREDTSGSATPNGSKVASRAPSMSPDDAKSAGDSTPAPTNGTLPKLSRKAFQKMPTSPAPLFDHLPDATEDACRAFQVINDCLYGSRNMGSSDHDALDCDCAEDWRKSLAPRG
jgi:histone-lysine N-methyltransferase SETD2